MLSVCLQAEGVTEGGVIPKWPHLTKFDLQPSKEAFPFQKWAWALPVVLRPGSCLLPALR